MKNLPIGVFDSGVGGLNILAAMQQRMPEEDYIYVADNSHAPYGNKPLEFVRARSEAIVRLLVSIGVKAIVVACNTATNVGIKALRESSQLPVFGVEPPVKPAALAIEKGKILLLCTPVTAAQPKFLELLSRYDSGGFTVCTLPGLAAKIETAYPNFDSLQDEVAGILSEHPDAAGVVLGCTHYYYLKPYIERYYSGRVPVFDTSDGVAANVARTLASKSLLKTAAGSLGREIMIKI